jgi:hypothetical protein
MGGKRTLDWAVNHPAANALRVGLAPPIALGTDDCDAVRHLDGTFAPLAAVSFQEGMTFVAPSVPEVILFFGRTRDKTDSFARRHTGNVLADKGYRLDAVLVTNAGFIVVHFRDDGAAR